MCDETTDRELDAWLERRAVTRRGFTVGASATLGLNDLNRPLQKWTPRPNGPDHWTGAGWMVTLRQ